MFNDNDFQKNDKKCIISGRYLKHAVRKREYKKKNGKRGIVIDGSYYDVIGIFEKIDPDKYSPVYNSDIVIPIEIVQHNICGYNPEVRSIQVKVTDVEHINFHIHSIIKLLTGRHRGIRDISVETFKWMLQMKALLKQLNKILFIISSVSLLLGGMGIMNVMLVSISDKMVEIGICKAIGANNVQILVRFLTESLLLSFTGGVFGTMIGFIPMVFRSTIEEFTGGSIELTYKINDIMNILILYCLLGILFGMYPAIKASRLKPVELLRAG